MVDYMKISEVAKNGGLEKGVLSLVSILNQNRKELIKYANGEKI